MRLQYNFFSNTAVQNAANGIGIEILRGTNSIPANKLLNIGFVGNNRVQLNFKARYALNGKALKAGEVRSVIGVSFRYNYEIFI